ncbi:hypothetical protein ABZ281_33195, partial [Streptomyces sp. NPDC006265]|uniref:hypothetical protein n=1 Tax=Streptomyces sp. NPDC006265 TaxID=3156740 RepID=UPI0033AF4D3A
ATDTLGWTASPPPAPRKQGRGASSRAEFYPHIRHGVRDAVRADEAGGEATPDEFDRPTRPLRL